MAIVNLCSRLVSCYGKYWLTSRTANAIIFTKHDHIFKGNVKPESLGAVMGAYRLLSCCVDASSKKVVGNRLNGCLLVDPRVVAKFAVEQHNQKHGAQLMFVELGDCWETCSSENFFFLQLKLKVSDQTGKFEYVKTEVSVQRELFQPSPLEYMTESEVSKCFSSGGRWLGVK